MKWLSVILAVLTLLVRLTDALARRKAIQDHEADIVQWYLGKASEDIRKAREARLAQRKRDADPSKLRDDDGFRRKD